jgi:TRAP transporter 4TM/12TM fusion protein
MVGGPSKVAVVGSSLFGTISGSGTANVATVGSVTIPMMKKAGYSSEFSAAVEAVASTGGQIMPPVMGAAAFVMSGFSGIPYATIIRYAIFPAILYYLSLFVTVDLRARRLKLSTSAPQISLTATLQDYGHMIIPIAILVYLLIAGYTPRLAGGFGIVTAIAASQFRRTTRLGVVGTLAALEDGAKGMLIIVASTAAAGLIVGTVDLTGLGNRMGSAFMYISGGNLLLGLILGMLIALLLGLGLPTTPAYIVQAATVIPALIAMGLPPFVAHMFAFYYSTLAIITPPDASAAYAAASLAEADGWKTGWLATRLAFVAFIVPFMFAYNQSILLVGPWWEVLITVSTASVGVFCLAAALEGYLVLSLNRIERVGVGAAALLLIFPSWVAAFPGAAVLTWLLIVQFRKKARIQLKTV